MEENKIILPENAEAVPAEETTAPGGENTISAEAATVPAEEVTRLREEHAETLRQVRIQGEVRYVLARMGAKNPDMAAKALDLTAVTVHETAVTGVEDAVRKLMNSDPYLFGMVNVSPSGGEGSSGGRHGENRPDPQTLSDREYYDMILGR